MGLVARNAAILLGGVALGASFGAGAAMAQPVGTNSQFVTLLERIVVGAGKAKIAIDTPQAVTVVDQADIDQKQAGTIGEILDDVPGVTMIGSERVLGESFNIRGIGAAETSGDEARIILTVDGARKFYEQYRMGSFFSDPELYKAAEVLRGPASSTLYGAGAFGGVINFTTKDASDFIKDGKTGAMRLKGSYSSNGNGALVSGILAHRINETFEVLAAGNFRRSDIVDLANGSELPGSEFAAWSSLLKGTIYIDSDQVVRLSYQRWNSDADQQDYAQTGTIPITDPQNFGLIDRTVDDQTAIISYENEAAGNDMLDLKVQLSYSNTAVSQENPTSPVPSSIFVADYGYQTTQLNVENTSTFAGAGWENFLTYGVQASHQNRVADPLVGDLITTHPEGTSSSIGVFAQSEHTINDTLTVIAGARADFSTLTPSETVVGASPSEDVAISPKLAALYKFNENFSVFGSAAHTERMPTLDEMFQYQGTRTMNPNLTKEYSDNFELGLATQADDIFTGGDSVAFKATAFHNTITDGIASNPIQANAPYFINIAGMRIWGLELEGSYDSDVMFARLAYTFTRGVYTEDMISSNPTRVPHIYAGDDVQSIPQDKLVLTVGGRAQDLDLEYGTRLTLAANPLTAATTVPPTPMPEGWATVDVFATWKPESGQFEGMEATFGIDNLFNADYRENLSMDRSKGRTFKLTLAKQFDY